MKCHSNMSRIQNCWNWSGMEYIVWEIFLVTFSDAASKWKLQNYPWEKFLDPQEKILYPWNNHMKKSWTHKTPTRKNLGHMKYPQEKIWDPQNTHKKKFRTHELPTRKYFGSTKYPQEKFLDPKITHKGMTPTMAHDPQYLAHSI